MTVRTRELRDLTPRILELIVKYPHLPCSAIAIRLVAGGVRRGKGRKG